MSDTKDIATEQREAWAGRLAVTSQDIETMRHSMPPLWALPPAQIPEKVGRSISGTPATILGEALAALGRTILLAEQSGCCSPHGATLNGLYGARSALEDLKRLADAREGR